MGQVFMELQCVHRENDAQLYYNNQRLFMQVE